jgi:PhoPQ-activated pathogenicity-related protein
MKSIGRVSLVAAGVMLMSLGVVLPRFAGAGEETPTTIQDYVGRDDPEFAWKIRDKKETAQGRMWEVDLTSQKWQGIVWRHTLLVFEPAKVRFPQHAILFITGGSIGGRPKEESLRIGSRLAELAQARVAMLHQVPNQPLLGNRKEDDLITETWLRFLASGDVTWVLQLPMVKR